MSTSQDVSATAMILNAEACATTSDYTLSLYSLPTRTTSYRSRPRVLTVGEEYSRKAISPSFECLTRNRQPSTARSEGAAAERRKRAYNNNNNDPTPLEVEDLFE